MAEILDFNAKKAQRDTEIRRQWESDMSHFAQGLGKSFVDYLDVPSGDTMPFLQFPLNVRPYYSGDVPFYNDEIGIIDDNATTIFYNDALRQYLLDKAVEPDNVHINQLATSGMLDKHIIGTVMCANVIQYFVNPPDTESIVFQGEGVERELDLNETARFKFWSAASGVALGNTGDNDITKRVLRSLLRKNGTELISDANPQVLGYLFPMNAQKLDDYLVGDQPSNVVNLFTKK